MNTAALQTGEVTKELMTGWSASARETVQLRRGAFLGTRNVCRAGDANRNLRRDEQKLESGLELARDYMHAKGITIGNEPVAYS